MPKVLIVNDKIDNITPLKKILEANDLEVDSAESGNDALKKVRYNSYTLIILDVQMPGIDGIEDADFVLSSNKTKDIPIILISDVTLDKKFLTYGNHSGALDYIIKPVDPDILILKVRSFVRLFEQNLELIQTQKSLRAEIEFRKEAESKKDEFISIASHELKTPLTSIKGYLQLLEKSNSDFNPTTKKYVQRTLIQIDKLGKLVADLLDTSKIESGQLQFNKKVTDFDELLLNSIEIIRQIYPGYQITKHGNSKFSIVCDENRIEQVIINYLTNAIKYSPDSKEISIYVEKSLTNMLTIKVQDNGIGISKKEIGQIFEKFYRVEDATHRFQGLGIGLYISAEIIRRHDGEFGVESKPGHGSTFYFSIPLLK